ncbi:hypothetical protein DLAC_10493 [Tieghemostelium lacteum]|uniref:Uncharacterized protein n=1 Tax=Tieghemostelium lacteum TaxID=361077 RepID=A0A151Z4L6_TIELA|nr:hypothetical protein DLAC_10493 [Tieghemostelium lacteum]|eukprot:KYQ88912.1 hypothetical protein DLAC_10493 [Tieghemostelium lacteum]
MGKASPVLHSRAALQDAYQSGGMISSFGGPRMETSLGGQPSPFGQSGEGIRDWFKKANTYLKDKKIISKVARALDSAGVPLTGTVGDVAEKYGYGKKRPRKIGSGKKKLGRLVTRSKQSGGTSYGINGGAKKRGRQKKK